MRFRLDRYQNSNNANFAPKWVFQWNTPGSSPSTGQISGRGAFFNSQHKLKSFQLANSRNTYYWLALNAAATVKADTAGPVAQAFHSPAISLGTFQPAPQGGQAAHEGIVFVGRIG